MWSHHGLLSKEAKERLISPRRSVVFTAADEWLWYFNLWSVITPKSFISFTFSSMWSFIWYDRLVLSLPICIHLHFCSLKDDVVSSSVLIVRYNFVSSANNSLWQTGDRL